MMKERFLTQNEITQFITYLVQEEKSQNTVEKYLRDVQSFSVFIGTGQVTKEAVIAYKRHLQSERYAVRSINSMLASVNSLFRFLGWSDCRVKTIKLQRQLCRPAEKELTKAEYTRLVNATVDNGNQRLNLIIQTMCSTGIRISELQFITVEAISRGEATVSLKGKTRPVFIVRPLQKKITSVCRCAGNNRRCGISVPQRKAYKQNHRMAGNEKPLQNRLRGSQKGVSPQSAPLVCQELLQFGQRYCQAGRHFRAQQH